MTDLLLVFFDRNPMHPRRATRIDNATGYLVFLALIALASTQVQAQGNNTSQYSPEQLRGYFQKTAEAYQMNSGGQELTLRKQPLMNWKNPVRTQSQGALYVWEKNGRPQVLGSIFTFEYNNVVRCRHELISLADGPLKSTLHSDVVWSPNRAGLEWTEFKAEFVPAASGSRRLFQMRSLARRFTGKLTKEADTTTLTLIPQPLVRYDAPDDGVIDGAVFSLAMGTDPEILLVIEATQFDGAAATFRYAPLRANFLALSLTLDGAEVWKVPFEQACLQTRAGQQPWSNGPFFPMTPNQPLPPPEQLR